MRETMSIVITPIDSIRCPILGSKMIKSYSIAWYGTDCRPKQLFAQVERCAEDKACLKVGFEGEIISHQKLISTSEQEIDRSIRHVVRAYFDEH